MYLKSIRIGIGDMKNGLAEIIITFFNQICGVAGFHCVQRYTNVHVTHRPFDSDTWLLETYRIANGCDCMWPTQEHGNIEHYHYNKENNTKYRCRPMYSEF